MGTVFFRVDGQLAVHQREKEPSPKPLGQTLCPEDPNAEIHGKNPGN